MSLSNIVITNDVVTGALYSLEKVVLEGKGRQIESALRYGLEGLLYSSLSRQVEYGLEMGFTSLPAQTTSVAMGPSLKSAGADMLVATTADYLMKRRSFEASAINGLKYTLVAGAFNLWQKYAGWTDYSYSDQAVATVRSWGGGGSVVTKA